MFVKKNSLKIIFLFIIYLSMFFSYFFINISSSAHYNYVYNTTYCSQSEEPIIITSNFTEIRNGNYIILARNEFNSVIFSLSSEYSFGVPSLELKINYSKNVSFSVFFSIVFPGSVQINSSGLIIAAVPIMINSSEFNNWTVSSPIVSNRYQKDSVAFYYITTRDFIRLETVKSETFDEVAFTGEFQGNGTYVFLGKIREPQPFWTNSFFYIGIGLFAIQLFIIVIIVKFVTDSIFGKKDD